MTTLKRVHPQVEQIRSQFNDVSVELYLIRGERNIIIDTGINQSPQKDIFPSLKSIGLTFSEIDLILNTHGHFDHTGGNAAVKDASGAKIFIHKDDAPFLYNRDLCFELYFAPVIKAMGGDLQTGKAAFTEMAGSETVADQQLEEGMIIDGGAGIELRVVCLPGHTLGSVGFFWEKEGILFSGDSVMGLHIEGGKFPIIFDIPAYTKSLQRLQEMPINFLLCGHPYRGLRLPPSFIRQGREVRQYLRECQEFLERLDEAVDKVKRDLSEKGFMQLADEVIAQLPKEMGFKPMTQVERPLYSAHTIFFILCQHGKEKCFKWIHPLQLYII